MGEDSHVGHRQDLSLTRFLQYRASQPLQSGFPIFHLSFFICYFRREAPNDNDKWKIKNGK
jgi:hypothetical protein